MGAHPAWRVAGATVTGAQHVNADEPCQDFHRVHVATNGVLIAIVSDGAGSAKFGGEGAALLCDTLVVELDAAFADRAAFACSVRSLARARTAVIRAIGEAREAVARAADVRNARLDDFHATLVGSVLLPGTGGLFFHIGDGAAFAIAADGDPVVLSAPANGEYSDTTYFFTQADWRANLRVVPFDAAFRTILLMSDGVTDLGFAQAVGGAIPHMPFFAPICRFLVANDRATGETALHATLDSPAARQRTGDDKTLVWAHLGAA